MSKRKRVVDVFSDLSAGTSEDSRGGAETPTPPVRAGRVGAGVIGATQRSMTELREERDRLHRALSEGRSVVTLDPGLIDPSPLADRLPDDDESGYEALKHSLRTTGQKVPIVVRPHPEAPARYQTVYGHRRVRALGEIGRAIDAQVVDYSDRDLIIAQGIENASRQDLSWIERALFAARMADRGLRPRDVRAALGVDDAQLSKFRTVTRAVPAQVIEAIGRAPGIGRPRWLELAEAMSDAERREAVQRVLEDGTGEGCSSDDRFSAALRAANRAQEAARPPRPSPARPLSELGTVTFGRSHVRIALSGPHADGFKTFLEGELDELVRRYRERLQSN